MGKNKSVVGTPLFATLNMLPKSNEELVNSFISLMPFRFDSLPLLGVQSNFIPFPYKKKDCDDTHYDQTP